MQTSKSYGGGRLGNGEPKLELDDLEYVFADGQSLIINSETNSEEADEGDIYYADGSQTVLLQTGVKHYIQTLAGETYLLGNDSDSVQQLVINSAEQSEESNSEVEYVQNDENGETVIYKLADDENENENESESQPQPKRFKIGDTEYVTLEDGEDLQQNDSDEISILNENSNSDITNFHYAVLKDGKLQLRVCDMNSVEVLNETSNDEMQIDELQADLQEVAPEFIDVNDRIQEYVLVNTNLPVEDPVGIPKVSGKDLVTGKAITLTDYLAQIQCKINSDETKEDDHSSCKNKEYYDELLNKKLLIKKNTNGTSLFGKILHIEPAKKATELDEETQDGGKGEMHEDETAILDVDQENIDEDPTPPVEDDEAPAKEHHDSSIEEQEKFNVENFPSIVYDQDVTAEHVDFLTKTFRGLVGMPSLMRKLVCHRLEVKYVEKMLDDEGNEVEKEVRHISGYLCGEEKKFIAGYSQQFEATTSLTVMAICDTNNQKTTKVIFHDNIICQICDRIYSSRAMLAKHMHTSHSDRNLCCNVCQLTFENYHHLNEHRKVSGHYLNCWYCNKRFATYSSWKRHQPAHSEDARHLKCVVCKKKFSNVPSLSKHLLTHSQMKAYRCDICGKSFMNFADLSVHRKVHNQTKFYYCDICRREFSRHSNLSRHAEIHKGDGDLYKCGICECSYKFISSLTRHIVQNHMKHSV